jgi:hypothetical protein
VEEKFSEVQRSMPVAHVHEVLSHIAPPLQAPSAQSDGANLYTGGPPIINYFSVSPAGPLWPGRQIELHWSVEGADAVEIVARDVAGSPPQELPPLAGPLPWVGPSSTTVTVPGSRTWRGLYVLRAKNRCTGTAAVEDALQVEMVLRRGLALGGGTRGDFQVGALLYLYDKKGFRPDAIASTSVGSINAASLVMGDDDPATTSPALSAAARVAATWLLLTDESEMWGPELWLAQSTTRVKQILRSLSIEGLLALPYAAVTNIIAINELADVFNRPQSQRRSLIQLGGDRGAVAQRICAGFHRQKWDPTASRSGQRRDVRAHHGR